MAQIDISPPVERFEQSDAIRDYIFPIVSVRQSRSGLEFNLLGTAFFIGSRGFALTAKHVVDRRENETLAGLFAPPLGGWVAFEIIKREVHVTEDVGLVQLAGGPWRSFFQLSNSTEQASCRYRLFGYPDDTSYELTHGVQVAVRPDLVYNEGYVRRRFTGSLPSIFGKSFYELSQVAGGGASGAPVCKFTSPRWDVIGIYAGEKLNDRATSVSYAVREESFRYWKPSTLGETLLAESN